MLLGVSNEMKKTITLAACILISLIMATVVYGHSFEIVGAVYTTDIQAMINGTPIPTYNVDGYLVVVGSNLKWYGFDVYFDEIERISHVTYKGHNSQFGWQPLESPAFYYNSIGTKVMDVYDTDITVLLNGRKVDSYNVDGYMAFRFSELSACGAYWYDNEKRTSYLELDLGENNYAFTYDDPFTYDDASSVSDNNTSDDLLKTIEVSPYNDHLNVPDFQTVCDGELILKKENQYVYVSNDDGLYKDYLVSCGYTEMNSYTLKYEDSVLSTSSGKVYTFKRESTEVHILSVNDKKLNKKITIISIDKQIKKPVVAESISLLVSYVNDFEDSTCVYKADNNNYTYGNTDTIYGSPIYVRKAKVSSATDLEKFLNNKYETLYSPMEEFKIETRIIHNSPIYDGFDFCLHVDFSYVSSDFSAIRIPTNLSKQNNYPHSDIVETVDMIKSMLYEMAVDIRDCFPGSSICGSIYVDGYHYPNLRIDYYHSQTLCFAFDTDFIWTPEFDDFSLE